MVLLNVGDMVKRGFPILSWSKDYHTNTAIADLVAGITIGLTLIPQSIAYAALAGLSPQYGLYSSLCGGVIYMTFGTIPELNIAPTALLSLLTFSYTHNLSFNPVIGATILCCTSGIIELLCGFLHLGFLVDFVSAPVVAAFTSAGAVTIASAQVKNLLGLKFSADGFISVWRNVFEHISETRKWDVILGTCCCVVLLSLRKLKDFSVPPTASSTSTKGETFGFKKFLWFVSVSRNAMVVILSAVAAYVLSLHESKPFSLTNQVPAGLPNITIPFEMKTENATTINAVNMLAELGSGTLVIPFVAILSNVAIAKAFAKGKVVDASQEMIAVGMCNLFGSFFSSFPICASFSRAAVSSASGVRTPLAGIYTSVMVVLALTFLTPYFPYIPKATLAAVIICAVIFMVEVTLTRMIWDISKIDLVPFIISFISCLLLGMEIGILIGVCVDLVILLYSVARPEVKIEKVMNESAQDYIKVVPSSAILFPSADFVRERIMRSSQEYTDHYEFVVIDCERINQIDFTAGQCLATFIADFEKIGKHVIFYRPKKSVQKMVTKATAGKARIVENEDNLYAVSREHNAICTVAARLECDRNQKGNVENVNVDNVDNTKL